MSHCASSPKFPTVNKCVTVVLGAQWGDEGKGKIVDMLAQRMDIVCRCQVSKESVCFNKALSLLCFIASRVVIMPVIL